ncbi:MAG: exodeoxyribonuclease VII large subunit [Limnohabitans sp.]
MNEPSSVSWSVSQLCRAVADALDARFNPVVVRGEISGFSRAASGHCYFSLKDEDGQIRCAMFRRAAGLLDFSPRDGEQVQVHGRLGVYEARGDLQLIVESMSRAGQGALFEQFLRLKARLEAEGLFDASRKRELPAQPRAIGVVTSPGAAAWHDVMTALQRRVPHIPVRMAPALVQGAGAADTLVQALQSLYAWTAEDHPAEPPIDVILLVRGGGSIEDLWAFNNEQLARVIAMSPVPVISGVGHETDFTMADFVADVRAPTPTAAAEMAATARDELVQVAEHLAHRLSHGVLRQLDRQAQRLDGAALRLGRPQAALARQSQALDRLALRLRHAPAAALSEGRHGLERQSDRLQHGLALTLQQHGQRSERLALRLAALDPQRVLERGYAWLSDEAGCALTRVGQLSGGQNVQATLADGSVSLVVRTAS